MRPAAAGGWRPPVAMKSDFVRRSYLASAEQEDEASAWLWAAGTLGCEVKPQGPARVRIEAYFAAGAAAPSVPAALAAGGLRELGVEEVPDADWMANWRDQVRPFPVGRRLLLDPREPQGPAADPGRRQVLRVPARTAFGTGSHESTRLVLELLETLDLRGRRVLDVGTGTGVLAFAALLFGARCALGFDLDPAAPLQAVQNARLNRLPGLFFAGPAAALRPPADFDLALVNVVPEEVGPVLGTIAALLGPGAQAIFSGVLRREGRRFLGELRRHGFRRQRSRRAGEWVAYHTEYRPR